MENARLLGELQARTAELAERNTAFAERIDHQAATIDVLKEMSASPADAQPVFDLICDQARALLGARLWRCSNMTAHWCIAERRQSQRGVRRSNGAERPMTPAGPECRTAGH